MLHDRISNTGKILLAFGNKSSLVQCTFKVLHQSLLHKISISRIGVCCGIGVFSRLSCHKIRLKRWMVPCQNQLKGPLQRAAMLSFIIHSLPAVSSVSLLRIINLPLALMMELYASGTFCAVTRKEFWEVCYVRCEDFHITFSLNVKAHCHLGSQTQISHCFSHKHALFNMGFQCQFLIFALYFPEVCYLMK